VASALDMQERMAILNQIRREKGLPELNLGIGLHTGPAVVGDVGPPHRREFTVVGGTVNLASRIEGLTRETGEPVLASEAVRAQTTQTFTWRLLDPCNIRGLDAPITPCAPSRHDPKAADPLGD